MTPGMFQEVVRDNCGSTAATELRFRSQMILKIGFPTQLIIHTRAVILTEMVPAREFLSETDKLALCKVLLSEESREI